MVGDLILLLEFARSIPVICPLQIGRQCMVFISNIREVIFCVCFDLKVFEVGDSAISFFASRFSKQFIDEEFMIATFFSGSFIWI